METIFWLQIIALSLEVVGVILALGSKIGWFTNKNKIDLFENIGRNIDPKHPAGKRFLKRYFYSLPEMNEKEKSTPIDKIICEVFFTGDRTDHRNLISGIVRVRNHQGKVSPGLCSLTELERWAKDTPFWNWLAWSLVVIGIVIQGIVLYIQNG